MQAYDLAAIFESKQKFQAKRFSSEETKELTDYLDNTSVFKKYRMLRLLTGDGQFDDLTWLEWFNWYYQGVSFSDFPVWLEEAKAQLNTKEITLVSYPILLDLGWEIKDVVKSSIDISSQGINNYIPTDDDLEHWIRLRSQNTDLFTGALLAGELVGQFGFIKITVAEYQQMSSGQLLENNIAGVREGSNEDVFLYIPSVVIKRTLQKKKLLIQMLRHLFEQFNNKVIKQQVKGFIALAFTNEGEKLCQQFNLTYQPSDIKDQKIYHGTTNALTQSKLFVKICGKAY
tara:strand:- start:3225 stop:4085 length:861 start_codon:yes stop_codon:yes gene_type:complete